MMLPGSQNGRKNIEYRISYWIHKNLTYTAVDSKRNNFTILLTRIWQLLSLVNNGVLHFLILATLLITGIVNDIWTIPVLGTILSIFFITRKTIIIVLVFFLSDVVLTAVLKYYFRRKRPPYFEDSVLARGGFIKLLVNKYVDNVGADKYTFPSGHCSRFVLLTVLTFFVSERNLLLTIPMAVMIIPMGIARVALAKHFLFDIMGGYVCGVVESGIFFLFWWLFLEWWVTPSPTN